MWFRISTHQHQGIVSALEYPVCRLTLSPENEDVNIRRSSSYYALDFNAIRTCICQRNHLLTRRCNRTEGVRERGWHLG